MQKDTIIGILMIVIVIATMIIIIPIGLKKQEVVDCYRYQKYEREFIDFQLKDEDIRRCESLGVEIIPFRNDAQKYNQY